MRWEVIQAYLWDIAARIGADIDDVRMRGDYTLIENNQTALRRLDPRFDSVNGSYVSVEVGTMPRRLITSWRLQPFPGNGFYCVSLDVEVRDEFRRMGVNTRSNAFRQEQARAYGYQVLLATVRNDNTPEIQTLARQGWGVIHQLPQTNGNETSLYRKVL